MKAAMFLMALLSCWSGSTIAGNALDTWRDEAAAARALAENDAAGAYKEALHLQAVIPVDATAEDKARALNLLARVEIYLALADQGGMHAAQALSIAKQHGDRIGQAEAYLNIATNSVNQARIDALVDATTNSLVVLDGVDRPDLLGEALLRTAMMYRRTGQLNDSVAMCVQALEIANRSRNPWALAYAHQCMGISFDQSGRAHESLAHFMRMREQARAAHSKILEGYALASMGATSASLGDPSAGARYLKDAIRLFRDVGTPTGLAYSLFAQSELLGKQGLHAEAVSVLNEVIAIYQRYPNKIGLWYSLNARSGHEHVLGQLSSAQRDVERAYALAKDIGVTLYISESTQRMAALYAEKGEHQRAYQLSVEAARLNAQAAHDASTEHILELTKRYQNESHKREVEALMRQNERQAGEIRQRALQQRWLWTVLGSSILIMFGAAFFLFRLRRSHRLLELTNTRLRHSQEEIRALNLGLEQRVHEQTSELRQQTRYLRTLIDMLPVLTWFKDTQSRFLVVNQAVAEAGGCTVEEMTGRSDLDFFPREQAVSFQADDREIMASRRRKTVQEQISADGKLIWIETYKAPVLDEDETVLGTVGYARDISEHKATEAAREEALEEARRLAHMRSQFLAQMSHELRTPLNGILGYAQIMRRNKSLDERQIEGLNVIQQSGEHLLMLINDILEFAKIDAGKMELTLGDMALDRFLRTIVSIIRVKAEQKHLQFLVDIAPDLPLWIRADEKRLRQVLLNLLANAVKFTDRGRVSLRVSNASPGRLHFEIGDTGMGIARDHLEKIFQPFEQAGDVRRRAAGTGLGLAISRQLVQLMGGSIEVESEPGFGSVFRFDVEASVAEAWKEAPLGDRRVTGYGGPRKLVLVVDDVAENRAVAIDMLAPLGFDTMEAENGREALEMAQLHPPDLILMDIVMPEMDGLQATRQLRQLPGFEEVPIMAVSASASGNDEETSLAAGMNVFLPKPLEFDRLLTHIAHLLKLEWLYEPSASEESVAAGPIIAPPPPEMEELHRLALQGNMRDILQMAAHLTALDDRYKPFADRLRSMAKGYQSKAILHFVERYLEGRQAS